MVNTGTDERTCSAWKGTRTSLYRWRSSDNPSRALLVVVCPPTWGHRWEVGSHREDLRPVHRPQPYRGPPATMHDVRKYGVTELLVYCTGL
jgi:hypothetical protein